MWHILLNEMYLDQLHVNFCVDCYVQTVMFIVMCRELCRQLCMSQYLLYMSIFIDIYLI